MKRAFQIASYFLVLGLGIWVGYQLGFRYGYGRSYAEDMANIGHHSLHMEIQLAEGTDSTREEILLGFLNLLDKRKKQGAPWFSETGHALDSALTNARLSALATKQGATDKARSYLDEAVSFCPQIGWEDCSEAKIVKFATKLDHYGLFSSKSTE